MSPKTAEKRAALRALSQEVKPLVKSGMYDSINDALVHIYAEEENCNIDQFNTFMGWKLKGYLVKKGEHARTIWGKPRNIKPSTENSTESADSQDEDKEGNFYPMAFLFSVNQVEPIDQIQAA